MGRFFKLLLATALAGLAPTAWALFQPFYYAQLVYGVNDGANNILLEVQEQVIVPATVGVGAHFSGCTLTTGPATSACATSFATAGTWRAQATLTETSPTTIPGVYEFSNANAGYRDVLTVSGLPAGAYTLVPTISIHGTSFWDNPAVSFAVGTGVDEYGTDGTFIQTVGFSVQTPGTFSETFSMAGVPFVAGDPFNFELDFGSTGVIANGLPADVNSFVNADFSSTMHVTGFKVLDSSGAEVSGYTIAAETGAIYGPGGIAVVPEPATLALFSLGIAGLALSCRRKMN